MPLETLDLSTTPITSLEGLRGMPLTELKVASTRIADLSPLTGIPLKALHIPGTSAADLSPLQGMRLEQLFCGNTQIESIAPLLEISTLRVVILPETATDIQKPRSLPNLQSIGYGSDWVSDNGERSSLTAQQFWNSHDSQQQGTQKGYSCYGVAQVGE